jgi:ubiquinone/menaquinone biosynthesis C-methylase UbiE
VSRDAKSNVDNAFSEVSERYALARPLYPRELYEWLASQCPLRRIAWDCATGNGQAAVGLAPYFEKIRASDISAEQIAHRIASANVEYSTQSAESTNFPDATFDLIVVAQALHWFDFPRFWAEVRRVARPGALFCAWGYSWPTTPPEIDRELVAPFRDLVEPFWLENNRVLWDGYPSEAIQFPFASLPEVPEFELRTHWTLPQLIAYLKTWSA